MVLYKTTYSFWNQQLSIKKSLHIYASQKETQKRKAICTKTTVTANPFEQLSRFYLGAA